MQSLTIVQTITIWILPVLLSITLHEAAHAWVASLCGDTTARALGRLSANPMRHIDPIGTVLVPITIGVLSGFNFVFGWAKPVPIDWRQLRHARRDMALVAIAGPLANIVMALFWASTLKIGALIDQQTSMLALFLVLSGQAGILINLVLAVLNLIPIPPLDGSRVVSSMLSPRLAYYYARIEPYGFLVILTLLVTGVLGWIMSGPILLGLQFIYSVFSL